MDKDYSKREIDQKFEGVHERFDSQDQILSKINTNQLYTNGKLKKVILALVLLGGVLIGVMGKEVLVPVLLKII